MKTDSTKKTLAVFSIALLFGLAGSVSISLARGSHEGSVTYGSTPADLITKALLLLLDSTEPAAEFDLDIDTAPVLRDPPALMAWSGYHHDLKYIVNFASNQDLSLTIERRSPTTVLLL